MVGEDRTLGAGERLLPGWIAPVFLGLTVLMAPWTAWLVVALPDRTEAHHWAIAWAGFDAMLAISLGATAVAIVGRRTWTEISAAVAGTLLVCDAWFDVLTAHPGVGLAIAAGQALLVELPLAALCFWIAWSVDRVLADARPHLERAGFRIRDRRLAPPGSVADRVS